MTRIPLLAVPALAACVASSPPQGQPPNPELADRVQTSELQSTPALLATEFSPPFDEIPISAARLALDQIAEVTIRSSIRVDDAWLRDAEVLRLEIDPKGQVTSRTLTRRGTLDRRVEYRRSEGRLVEERHLDAQGKLSSSVQYQYDSHGHKTRQTRTYRAAADRTTEFEHDAKGRLVRAAASDGSFSRSISYASGRRVVEDIVSGSGKTKRSFAYNARGELARIVDTPLGSRRSTDRYDFQYDGGRLRSLRFTEGEMEVYTRRYEYDENGRLIASELLSKVPAMGKGKRMRYEYRVRGDLAVRDVSKRKATDHAEYLSAALQAFPGSYKELAEVRYETSDGKSFSPAAVDFLVPEVIVKKWSDKDLKRMACTAKKKLGLDCACEIVNKSPAKDYAWHSWVDKRVVKLTLRFMIAC